MIKKIRLPSMWIAVAMVLSSCGEPDINKSFSRMSVTGIGEVAAASQLDSALAPHDNTMPAQAWWAAAPARERIVDQELLAQEALQIKLDSDVQVALAIEHARQQILAQAYIERAVNSASPAEPQEITRFYADNPALFERRRIYSVRELSVIVSPQLTGALQDAVAGAKNLAGVVHWLDSRKLPFEVATPNRAAEQIPLNILRRFFEMRDGQMAVFPTAHGASVVLLERSVEAPLSEQQARPAIARYLLNSKRLALAQAEVTKLRERAKLHHHAIEAVRPVTEVQTAAREQPRVAQAGSAHDTADFTKLR